MYAGAEAIAALPFATTLDTTEATTDADDAELNGQCGAPAMDASVWYSYTAEADSLLLADAFESDYSAGVLVATGAPGNFLVQGCGPGGAGWEAMAGETYYIVVFDDQEDGTGNGGTMSLTVDVAPPAPAIEATVNPLGWFDARTGFATISGTVTCDSSADFAFVDVTLQQRVGRFIVRGYGGTEVFCDGTPQPWSAEISGETGLFKGGRALSVSFSVACNSGGCSEYFDETEVRLTGKKR
ncbi:hypothetical protein DN585_16910 [Intrasporangium calvum]|nr:hypothetical protein DN585_16910 [Intrasporangium calvum]